MDDFDRGGVRAQQREEERLGRLQAKQFAGDVREALGCVGTRRVVWAFLQAMGVDGSVFNPNAMTQSHSAGLQDAGRWWLNVIREVCPEREGQMRAEGNKGVVGEQE